MNTQTAATLMTRIWHPPPGRRASCVACRSPRAEDRAREVGLVDAIRPQLRLQTYGPELLPASTLAMPPGRRVVCLADEVACVHLQARRVREYIHHETVRADELGRMHLLALTSSLSPVKAVVQVQRPGFIHHLAEEMRDASQVKPGALNAQQLARHGRRGIHGGCPGGHDLQLVVQGVAGLVALEVPVRMVGQADDRGLVSGALVAEVQLTVNHLICDAHNCLARVALVTVRRYILQRHRRVRFGRQVERLAPEALDSAMQVVRAVVRLELVALAVKLELGTGDPVGTTAHDRAEVGLAIVRVPLERLITHQHIDPLTPHQDAGGDERAAQAADVNLQGLTPERRQMHLLPSGGAPENRWHCAGSGPERGSQRP
eukprot:CAMPEP_0195078824 /NCGR_PEP_ID=MMETSP0448-20130528/20910_1 /TAXON_ID=66468 /ORGANISM="Heterocapsa triquestra, Strain CCMP 448" /LENGTH=374 /DNA_ID=CAMNT_0040111589 /DNA_START=212 /DNA_END=1334 /DNA_ORIENTATION=-